MPKQQFEAQFMENVSNTHAELKKACSEFKSLQNYVQICIHVSDWILIVISLV